MQTGLCIWGTIQVVLSVCATINILVEHHEQESQPILFMAMMIQIVHSLLSVASVARMKPGELGVQQLKSNNTKLSLNQYLILPCYSICANAAACCLLVYSVCVCGVLKEYHWYALCKEGELISSRASTTDQVAAVSSYILGVALALRKIQRLLKVKRLL
jgi:hypothetical protein